MGARLENQVFNNALSNVDDANAALLEIYESARERITTKLAKLRQQAERGLLNEAQERRLNRVERFLQSIVEDIRILKRQEAEIIVNGFTANYANGYYGYGFSINYDVNNVILSNQPFDYVVQYRRLNLNFVRQIYMQEIASSVFGGTIKERTAAEILLLQEDIKKAVTQALLEGLSPRQLARRLKEVDAVFNQNFNHALTVARTELLRGHSWGTEQAINIAQDQGVEGRAIWDATLDGNTRPLHGSMDQKSRNGSQPKADGLFHFSNGDATSGPRMPGLSPGNAINCRCNKQWLPFGLSPNSRGFRAFDGSWKQTTRDIGYEEWSNTLQGRASIAASRKEQRARANRLAKIRRKKRKAEFTA